MKKTLRAPWRLGVDIGGTFTDLAIVDADGVSEVYKVASTPENPTRGVVNVIEHAADAENLSTFALLGHCSLFVHGSTIATNALLESRGARVGLLTTTGFRDSLAIRRGIRENAWAHRVPYPEVLVPRYLRLPVDGRIDRHGKVSEPLSLADVDRALTMFEREGVESIAICLFNSFLSADHEIETEAYIASKCDFWLSRSSAIAPVMGEFERTSTTVINAYVAPRVAAYLGDLSNQLAAMGLAHPMQVVQNHGGLQSIEQVVARPASLLLSGPAAIGGALMEFCRTGGEKDLISMEVGGTSCDVSMVHDGEIHVADAFQIADQHVCLTCADIHTIGAGGGTLAGCDAAGLLWVGPQGAGAVPGPAAYLRGGQLPTVTDAALVLGQLRPGPLAEHSLSLNKQAAIEAIKTKLAQPLEIGVQEAALGVMRLLVQKLTQAIEDISSARGYDPRVFALVAGGGAGPMVAGRVARALGCREVVIPNHAGALCALGMCYQDVSFEYSEVFLAKLNETQVDAIANRLQVLRERADQQLQAAGFSVDNIRHVGALDIRYPSQLSPLRTPVKHLQTVDVEDIRYRFGQHHERIFGYQQADVDVEVVTIRLTATGLIPRPKLTANHPQTQIADRTSTREVIFDDAHTPLPSEIFDSRSLSADTVIDGPAIIEAATTTIVVGPDDQLTVDPNGYFRLRVQPSTSTIPSS